jgi:hypothetical protein
MGMTTADNPAGKRSEAGLFEADDLDAARGMAARIPTARSGGAVEVRPLVER